VHAYSFLLNGETLESLYRTGTQQEIEEALAHGCGPPIHRLEAEKAKPTVPAHSLVKFGL